MTKPCDATQRAGTPQMRPVGTLPPWAADARLCQPIPLRSGLCLSLCDPSYPPGPQKECAVGQGGADVQVSPGLPQRQPGRRLTDLLLSSAVRLALGRHPGADAPSTHPQGCDRASATTGSMWTLVPRPAAPEGRFSPDFPAGVTAWPGVLAPVCDPLGSTSPPVPLPGLPGPWRWLL